MNLREGTILQDGKYRIVRFINSGGFGCTYEAEHTLLRKRLAIKEFFVKDFCNRDEATGHVSVGTQGKQALVAKLKRKFIEEAKVLSRLHHKGIVSVTDVFEENGTAYYVMDYIDGCSLGDIHKREGALSEARALGYIRQVAEALAYVHEHNRLHLDIKPGNIMVDGDDRAVLIDFGVSKQYDEEEGFNESTLIGKTPGYAPPEQMDGDVSRFLPATDIYALGATLYALLTGVTPLKVSLRISGESLDPLPACTSAAVTSAVEAAMKLKKDDRPQTISEFLTMLDAEDAADDEDTIINDEDEKKLKKTASTVRKRGTRLKTKKMPSAGGWLKAILGYFIDYRGCTTRKRFLLSMIWTLPICMLAFLGVDNPLIEFKSWMKELGFGSDFTTAIWNILPISFILFLTMGVEMRRLNDCGKARWWAYAFNLPLLLLWLPDVDLWYQLLAWGEWADLSFVVLLHPVSILLSLYIAIRFFMARSR